jgi:hypothetical protein
VKGIDTWRLPTIGVPRSGAPAGPIGVTDTALDAAPAVPLLARIFIEVDKPFVRPVTVIGEEVPVAEDQVDPLSVVNS